MPKIFISYQHGKDDLLVGRIQDRLTEAFGFQQVLAEVPMNKVNYDASLAEAFEQIDFVIAVITPDWREEVMNNENHPMYQELLVALRKDNLKVLPVLVNGATMPEPTEYPMPLRRLHYRNPYPMQPGTQFQHDMDRLMRRLQGFDQTQVMTALPESRGCIFRSQLYLFLGTLVLFLVITLIVASLAQINIGSFVEGIRDSLSNPPSEPLVIDSQPTLEPIAPSSNELQLMSDGGLVRSAPDPNATLLYTASSNERLEAFAQTRTTHEAFPTWLLVELPNDPGSYGWIWIGAFDVDSQEVGFGLPFYEELPDADETFPIG